MGNMLNRLKVEIVELLQHTFLGLEKLLKSCYCIIALNIANRFPYPNTVKYQDKSSLITSVFNSVDKGLSTKKRKAM